MASKLELTRYGKNKPIIAAPSLLIEGEETGCTDEKDGNPCAGRRND